MLNDSLSSVYVYPIIRVIIVLNLLTNFKKSRNHNTTYICGQEISKSRKTNFNYCIAKAIDFG